MSEKLSSLRALVVGGGVGGMAAAVRLREIGVRVDLIDLDPEWRVYGAGITVTRPTLRAFRDLGILEEFLEVGFAGDGIQVCDVNGVPLGKVPDPVLEDPLPGSGGVMRPELHRILSQRVLASGTSVRLGLTVSALEQGADQVSVLFSDGSKSLYDFVIGADGVFSSIRGQIFPDADKPAYTGQTVWRLYAPRPPEIIRRHFFLGGPYKVGLCPVSETHLYMFLLEDGPRQQILPDEQVHVRLRELMQGYGDVLSQLREGLDPASPIIVRPLEAFLLPAPWYDHRVLLIGDAAHPTTPQLASGAGIAVEDALVLGEELAKAGGDVPRAFQAFMARRWERCRIVVENSIEIGRREQAGRPPEEQTILVEQSLAKLAEPI